MNKSEFLNQCKKNREYLNYSTKDVADALIDFSAEDYENFENGRSSYISKENLRRLVDILCLKSNKQFNINDYINTSDLEAEEVKDLKKVIEYIVGDEND